MGSNPTDSAIKQKGTGMFSRPSESELDSILVDFQDGKFQVSTNLGHKFAGSASEVHSWLEHNDLMAGMDEFTTEVYARDLMREKHPSYPTK